MKRFGIISAAVLTLTLGVTTPGYAQHDQQDEKRSQSEQKKGEHEKAKPEQHARQQSEQKQQQPAQLRQDQDKQKQHARQQENQNKQHAEKQQQNQSKEQAHVKPQPGRARRETEHAQQQERNQPQQRTQERQRVEHSAWQQHRSQHWDSDHRTWQQRGGYNGYRIPDDRFRGYFGRDHGFRISGLPFLVVGGYPRFQYSGYWFSPVDPWPEYWANDWYDTDDVYVVYMDNGYYMFNRRYPNNGIAIRISL